MIKAYALANTSIESGYISISPYMEDIAKTLTASNFKILFQVHLPLLKTSFLTSALLVISEVIKELPATLILRPFNFDTLSVRIFQYAGDERIGESILPALIILFMGLVASVALIPSLEKKSEST